MHKMEYQLRNILGYALLVWGAGAISLTDPARAEFCPNEERQARCGGGSTARNEIDQMSCSPFAYKPWSFINANGVGYYNKKNNHDQDNFCLKKAGQRHNWRSRSISGLDV